MEERHVEDKMRAWKAVLGFALYPGSLERAISCVVLSTAPAGNDKAMA